jgi:beta-lactam-binding protein with PASTA domain
VPSLIGSSQAEATAALERVGLEVGEVTREFSNRPVGTVLRSNPPSGEQLKPGTPVALVVSKGVEQLPVPDVTGQERAAAEKALDEAGFTTTVTEVFSDTVPAGRVAAQDPNAGRAPRGSRVTLQVSKGPEPVTVPDVIGQKRKEAEARLEALGLKVQVRAIPGPGTVRSTDPRPGSKVRKGSTVTLYVY